MRIIGSGYDGDLNLTSVIVEEDGREYWFENPRWISVEERLPENDDDVMVFSQSGVSIGYYSNAGYWVDYTNVNEEEVTHWMPLPEPPKEEK